MTATHAIKNGVRYRYYVSRCLVTGVRGEQAQSQTSGQRIPAGNLESLFVHRLRSFFADAAALHDALPLDKRDAPSQKQANTSATEILQALDGERADSRRNILRPLVARVQFTLIGSTLTSAPRGSWSGFSTPGWVMSIWPAPA